MDTPKKNIHISKKLIGLFAPFAIYYILYQKYANTHEYLDYLDIYVKQAITILTNWFNESVEFQRGILGAQDAAIVSQTDYNYVTMTTDKDPLFMIVVLLTFVIVWPSRWISKVIGVVLSTAITLAAVPTSLVGSFFWATYYPLVYSEYHNWVTGVALFIVGLIFIPCYILIAGKKNLEAKA